MFDSTNDAFAEIEIKGKEEVERNNDPSKLDLQARRDLAFKMMAEMKEDKVPVEKRLRQALLHCFGDMFAFNQLTNEIEFQGKRLRSVDFDEAHHFLDDQVMGYMGKKDHAKSAVRYVANANAYHPVARYLNAVADAHDLPEVTALDVCNNVIGDSTALVVRYIECWLAGAVSKAMDPEGSKFIEVLSLISVLQGIGKSYFFKVLASPQWFSDSFSEHTGKDQILGLHRAWINELGEVDQYAARARDFKGLKSLISQTDDMIRVPYSASTERKPRRFVMGATANEPDLFANDDQQRRFWVIVPEPTTDDGRMDMDWLIANRDAIWATAVRRWRELGEDAYKLTPQEQQETIERNRSFEKENVNIDPIAQALEEFSIKRISTGEVLKYIIKDGKVRANQIGPMLRDLGYFKVNHATKLGKKFRTLWEHPDRAADFDEDQWESIQAIHKFRQDPENLDD